MVATRLPLNNPAETPIGVIGLGLMGKPMALNLLRQGFPVRVYNRSQKSVDELAAQGAIACESPAALAQDSVVVITMLPDAPEVVDALYEHPSSVFSAAQPGKLIIDMSTIGPNAAVKIGSIAQERDLDFLDAPVSGGDTGAIAATLSIMVGAPSRFLSAPL